MRKYQRSFSLLLVVAFLAGLSLSSCKVFMGDPRKNCNHPQHGQYMMEQQKKRMGF